VGSFFDIYSSFQDLQAYFFTQPKEKKHLAALLDVVHQEVHAVSVQPNQAVRSSSVGVTVTVSNTEGFDPQKDAEETVASTKREQLPSLASQEEPSHQRLAYTLSELQRVNLSQTKDHENRLSGASEEIAVLVGTTRQSVDENSIQDKRTDKVVDRENTKFSLGKH
jgi:hypothetical protein